MIVNEVFPSCSEFRTGVRCAPFSLTHRDYRESAGAKGGRRKGAFTEQIDLRIREIYLSHPNTKTRSRHSAVGGKRPVHLPQHLPHLFASANQKPSRISSPLPVCAVR